MSSACVQTRLGDQDFQADRFAVTGNSIQKSGSTVNDLDSGGRIVGQC